VNSRITLAVFMALGTLMTFSAVPSQLQLQNALAQDDESDNDTEQRLRQKNLGSGESDNFNCAENLITSASDSIECIPSGPAPPTPPPQAIPFTISGEGLGFNTFICDGVSDDGAVGIQISAQGQEDGTVMGSVNIQTPGSNAAYPVSGGTTDGNTFSLNGEISEELLCGTPGIPDQFTVSGDCGNNVMISYEESESSATVTGDVRCTVA
jgi:hypothetical protein